MKPARTYRLQTILGLALTLLLAAAGAAEPVRVMTYNVLYGFDRKKSLDQGVDWIAKQDTDVLALQELKGFTQQSLEAAARRWGHPHAAIFKRKGGFPQGITSRHPITDVAQIQPEGAPGLRGTLHVRIKGMHYFVVHFDPRNYRRRQQEAAAVIRKCTPLLTAGEPVIVLGDFNAHSPADKATILAQTGLVAKWRTKQQEQKGSRSFDDSGQLDFSVMASLLEAGLVDPAVQPAPTFPTRLLAPDEPDDAHAAKLQRIDFILTDPATARKSAGVTSPRDAILDKISDHYPVILNLK